MEDLGDRLAQLLSSPEAMDAVRSLMETLGAEPPGEPSAPAGADGAGPGPAESPGGMPDLGMLARLMPLLSRMNDDDDSTRLLLALRPHLSEERKKKLDRALQLMKVLRWMPLLTEQGLFGL